MAELDIDIQEQACCGGEYSETTARVPDLVVECLEYLLRRYADDPDGAYLLRRLQEG